MNVPGREAQYAAFYEDEFGRTVAAVRRQLGADAEDVAQEAFIVAARRWNEVAELDLPAAWVRLVARRIAGRRLARERYGWHPRMRPTH